MKISEVITAEVKEILEATPTVPVIELLSVEQKAALEGKFLTLPIEVRSAAAVKYPGRKTYELYVIRQMVKEANGRLASQMRPTWYNTLQTNATSLRSGSEDVRKWSEKTLRELADSLDAKESAVLLKKYKNSHDLTSDSDTMKQLAGIFGVETATLK